ncbi:MAG: class I SAM-dependent methyltransferase family protein, partial [Tannerellaceae bacterium]|nr:class I SAM-dependent methyltransferase family protein [Tannerellaceae bacterium]
IFPFFTTKLTVQLLGGSSSKLGFLSQGMKVGIKYGFDSGISLDYVYKNKPQGLLDIGKLMDYFYLNAIGLAGYPETES